MLVRRMSQMHKELYGNYEEFTEVNMRFQELEDTGIETAIATAVDKAVVTNEERSMNRTARAMKAKGLNASLIAEITGLSVEKIENM